MHIMWTLILFWISYKKSFFEVRGAFENEHDVRWYKVVNFNIVPYRKDSVMMQGKPYFNKMPVQVYRVKWYTGRDFL